MNHFYCIVRNASRTSIAELLRTAEADVAKYKAGFEEYGAGRGGLGDGFHFRATNTTAGEYLWRTSRHKK